MTTEQKAVATRDILTQAAATGGLMILGVGLGRKFVAPNKSELNLLLKNANLGNDLEQLVKNDLAVQKFFVAHGKGELNGIYNDYLLGVKTGKLKAGSFEQYLELRVAKQINGRRNLDSHEGVSGVQEGKQIGHTTLKHVGKSERWLQNRIRREGVREASSFYNNDVGNRTVGKFKKLYETEINQWLKSGDTDPFEATIDMEEGNWVSGYNKQERNTACSTRSDKSGDRFCQRQFRMGLAFIYSEITEIKICLKKLKPENTQSDFQN